MVILGAEVWVVVVVDILMAGTRDMLGECFLTVLDLGISKNDEESEQRKVWLRRTERIEGNIYYHLHSTKITQSKHERLRHCRERAFILEIKIMAEVLVWSGLVSFPSNRD